MRESLATFNAELTKLTDDLSNSIDVYIQVRETYE